MATGKRGGVGIDVVDVARFARFKKNKKHPFLAKVFSAREIAYCFGYAEPASHLAGMFAAKEATSKALGAARYPFAEIEIRHDTAGKPLAYRRGRRLPVLLSITHTGALAAAIAVW